MFFMEVGMENFTNTVRDAGTISVTRRRVLRLPAVINRTGLSRSQIYRLMELNEFPHSARLSPAVSGWDEGEVDLWLNNKFNKRDEAQMQRVIEMASRSLKQIGSKLKRFLTMAIST